VYVDDFLIAGESDETSAQIYQQLNEQIKLPNLGFPKQFLGLEFIRHKDHSISLHQAGFIEKILAKFDMKTLKENLRLWLRIFSLMSIRPVTI